MHPAAPHGNAAPFDVSGHATAAYGVRHCGRLRFGGRCAVAELRGRSVTVVGVRGGRLWVRADGAAAAAPVDAPVPHTAPQWVAGGRAASADGEEVDTERVDEEFAAQGWILRKQSFQAALRDAQQGVDSFAGGNCP
eukprot:gene54887-17357_t